MRSRAVPNTNRRGRPMWGNSLALSERASTVDEPSAPDETKGLMLRVRVREALGGPPATRAEVEQIRTWLRDNPMTKPAHIPLAVVYYFRVGNRIKIGHTANLLSRVRGLMPEEILGWEPGEPALERARHRQFAQYRVTREWFEDCPAIRAHIQQECMHY